MKHLAFNPYLPSYEYVPDAEPRVFGNRLYIYGSHDRFGGEDFCLNDYVCWSAPLDDLGDWRCEGVIYRASQDPKNTDGTKHMNAPDCAQGLDGRYYLYYQLQMDVGVSVAVCDSPAGKFEFYGYVTKDGVPYGSMKGDPMGFDPGVLVEDGRVWLYTGFSPLGMAAVMMKKAGIAADGSYCVELAPDMLTVLSEPKLIVPGTALAEGTDYAGHGFFEASSIRKIGSTYYFVYSSILSHELCYATSDKPDGPFRYGGTLVSIGDVGYHGGTEATNYLGNTHGGMVELGGDWYIFYHRQTNKQKCARQACAEKLTILPDGSIPQVEVTSCGLNGGPLPAKGRYEARIACNLSSREGTFAYEKSFEPDERGVHPYFTQSGEDRESDGDQYIANLTDGAWCGFKYFCFDGTEKTISLTVRGTAESLVKVCVDRAGKPVAELAVSPSEEWREIRVELERISGTAPLFFLYEGTGSLDFSAFEIV